MSLPKLDDSTKFLESSILYQNSSKTVIVIDVPRSITHAQGESESRRELYSTEPRKEPFTSTEPRSQRARNNVATRNAVDTMTAEIYTTLIEKAIADMKRGWKGAMSIASSEPELYDEEGFLIKSPKEDNNKPTPMQEKPPHSISMRDHMWAHRRHIRENCDGWKGVGRKRNSDEFEALGTGEVEGSVGGSSTAKTVGAMNGRQRPRGRPEQVESFSQEEGRLQSLMKAVKNREQFKVKVFLKHPGHVDEAKNESTSEGEVDPDGVWHNSNPTHCFLTFTEQETSTPSSSRPLIFHFPPLSTCLLSDCADSIHLRTSVREFSAYFQGRRDFDFILLDPPWSNASAKRSSPYSTASHLRNLKKMLLQMDLDIYIPPSGYVGIWITNAPTVRNLVLGAGGLFEAWNLTLVEEWVWVKTTRHGEPVTSIHGSWRRPYEVFLIGKAPAHRLVRAAKLKEEDTVKRVLFGCPDLHSRKPCLKILIEGLRMVKKSGRVLEIFARHLVAGWWSWGDEVLKFNWEKHWTDGVSKEDDGDRIEDAGANTSGAGCSRSDSSG